MSKLLTSLMRNYFPKGPSGSPLHTLSKLKINDVPVGFAPTPSCSTVEIKVRLQNRKFLFHITKVCTSHCVYNFYQSFIPLHTDYNPHGEIPAYSLYCSISKRILKKRNAAPILCIIRLCDVGT